MTEPTTPRPMPDTRSPAALEPWQTLANDLLDGEDAGLTEGNLAMFLIDRGWTRTPVSDWPWITAALVGTDDDHGPFHGDDEAAAFWAPGIRRRLAASR